MSMEFPPPVKYEIPGWKIDWAVVEAPSPLAKDAWEGLLTSARLELERTPVTDRPEAKAVRRLFRAAGCDPTRYRPSSEALARRLLKTGSIPSILPLVDINNILSLKLLLPCCVVDPSSLSPPLTLRVGRKGEEMVSLRGPFKLAGKPLLADGLGPFGTPITDSERVKVTPALKSAWLLVYRPEELPSRLEEELEATVSLFPEARVLGLAVA